MNYCMKINEVKNRRGNTFITLGTYKNLNKDKIHDIDSSCSLFKTAEIYYKSYADHRR